MPSFLYTALWEDFSKAKKPNTTLLDRLYHYPTFAYSTDEVLLDAGFCKTSLDNELYAQINAEKSQVFGDTEHKKFIWVITNKRLHIINEKWLFGFAIDIEKITVKIQSSLGIGRSRLVINGDIKETTSPDEGSLIKKGEIDISFTGSSAGISNIYNFIKFFDGVQNNFVNKKDYGFGKIKKIQLFLDVDGEKTERDFFVYWVIDLHKEVLFSGISPSLLGTANKDEVWRHYRYVDTFIEGKERGFKYNDFSLDIFNDTERFPIKDNFWKLDELTWDGKLKSEIRNTIWEN